MRLTLLLLFALSTILSCTSNTNNTNNKITNTFTNKEQKCMAIILYHESRGEINKGIYAVGEVVLNRVLSNNYPNNVCKVLTQKYQFSFYNDNLKQLLSNYNKDDSWKKIVQISKDLTNDYKIKYINNATGFVHIDLNPKPNWTNKASNTYTIGNHIFYEFNTNL